MNTKSDDNAQVTTQDCGCGAKEIADQGPRLNETRRHILRAGASAGPVLLALRGRSAMAGGTGSGGTCTFPSAWASLNPNVFGKTGVTSLHPNGDSCSLGRTPGYWKQAQKRCFWPGSVVVVGGVCKNQNSVLPPVPDSLPCSDGTSPTGSSPAICGDYKGDGTLFSAAFGSGPNVTMMRLLCGSGYQGSTDWHYCAALLNAYGVVGYPLKPIDVVQMYNGTYVANGVAWTRDQGLQYIQSVYDTSMVDPTMKFNHAVPCCA